jgi:hypothetical protein
LSDETSTQVSDRSFIVEERVVKRTHSTTVSPKKIRRIMLGIVEQVLIAKGYNPNEQANQVKLRTILSDITVWDLVLEQASQRIDDVVAKTLTEKLILHIREVRQENPQTGVNVWNEITNKFGKE